MDILEFYGLREDPFRLTPDPLFFYSSAGHNDALQSLHYLLKQREGFCLVTGEPGTGKTTLLNVFKGECGDNAEIALILTPSLPPEDFLLAVLDDFNITAAASGKNEILRAFRDFLLKKSEAGLPVVIMVDEAQNLPDETLEELRLLSNLETHKDKLLQIILFGQPELEQRLGRENLKQLNQRISVRVKLKPLSSAETMDYVNYRLIKAGKGCLRLDDKLLKPIHHFSSGIPRIINLLSSRAIMSAYIEGSNVVTPRHVRYAVRHLADNAAETGNGSLRRILHILTALIIVIAGGMTGYRYIEQRFITATAEKNLPLQRQHGEITSQAAMTAEKAVQENPVPASENVQTVTVTVQAAHVRSGPSIESGSLSMVTNGAILQVAGEFKENTGEKWYKVITPDNNEGWVSGRVVTVE